MPAMETACKEKYEGTISIERMIASALNYITLLVRPEINVKVGHLVACIIYEMIMRIYGNYWLVLHSFFFKIYI